MSDYESTTQVITDFDKETESFRQTVTIGKCAVSFVVDTREPIIREALEALGWTPPTKIVTPKPRLVQ